MPYPITTQTELRASFWRNSPHHRHEYTPGKRQNDYPADVRAAFVDYVDMAQRNIMISDDLADRASL